MTCPQRRASARHSPKRVGASSTRRRANENVAAGRQHGGDPIRLQVRTVADTNFAGYDGRAIETFALACVGQFRDLHRKNGWHDLS